jgi:DNA-binding transcriptional MocR family regulator
MYQIKLIIVSSTMWLPQIEHREGPTAQRILDALVEAVNEGTLSAGTQLPPHRELADSLGVALGTVSRAYALARDRGLITGTVGRGTFVAAREADSGDPSGDIDLSQNLIRWDPGESVAGLLRDALLERNDLRTLMEVYPKPAGWPEHRRIAAGWLARRGISVSEEQVVVTNGAQHGLLMALALLSRPGDVIATEHVTYTGIKTIASQLQLQMAGLPMDEEGLLPEALDRLCASGKVRLLYTIPTLQNPTGGVMSEDRRETIADIARRRNVTILEDDIYSFLVAGGPPPIAAFAPERCYFVTSLSKGVFPGLRVGFMVCPPGAAERVAEKVRMSLLAVSPLASAIGARWLEDGTVDRIMERKRIEMRWRWHMATQVFGIQTRGRHAAAHLWLPLPAGRQPQEVVPQLQARGVLVGSAEVFAVDPTAVPRAIRICLGASLARVRLQQALSVIQEVIEGRAAPAPLI